MAVAVHEPTPEELVMIKAGEAAFRQVTIEIYTLLGVAISSTILRTYARIRAVGIKGLRADDYFVWLGVAFYAAQCSFGYSIGNLAKGVANNGMTDEQRAALDPTSMEFEHRVLGSKIQVMGWTAYTILMMCLKLSMLTFYVRLTEGLGRPYRVRINIGYGLLVATFVASILAIFVGCRPFHHYWQINPDPGRSCQAAVSRPIIWTSFTTNLITDIYLIMIPLPMLWGSSLKTYKKVASTIVLGAGIFVLVCAILKTILVLTDQVNGAALAGSWGVREAFTAVMVTNLPMIFPLFKNWLRPFFGSALSSSGKAYKYKPDGFQTIGGGGASYSQSRKSRNPGGSAISANMTFNDSEERMVDSMKMQNIRVTATPSPADHPAAGILVSNQVEITHENRQSVDFPGHAR